MIRAFGDMAQPKMECRRKTTEAWPRRVHWPGDTFNKIQLIERLILVARLACELDVVVVRDKAIHKVDRDAALVMVLKNKSAVINTWGKGGG